MKKSIVVRQVEFAYVVKSMTNYRGFDIGQVLSKYDIDRMIASRSIDVKIVGKVN